MARKTRARGARERGKCSGRRPPKEAGALRSVGRAAAKAEPARPEEQAKPERQAHPPKGYEEMTVAEIAEAAPGWRRPNLEAALEHERAHAKRKGAISALESALAAKEES